MTAFPDPSLDASSAFVQGAGLVVALLLVPAVMLLVGACLSAAVLAD